MSTSFAATQTFSYAATTQTFTIPSGVVSLSVVMRGGAGGMGGTDGYAGGVAGNFVGYISGNITVTPGQVITVAVGKGGGSTSACLTNTGAGSAGVNPLTGYNGGSGGNAGTQGCSGGGGGGGAATVLQISGSNVVAAGGGGSGGGNNVSQKSEQNSKSGSTIAGTTGSNGTGPTGDGGGGGGGGGGANAGAGGTAAKISSSAEFYGYGGNAGTSSTAGIQGLSVTTNTYIQSTDGYVTFTYNADTTAPTVSSLSSDKANGTYKAGEVIDIRVSFSEIVTVTGTPQITLETGSINQVVNYSSGSGTTVLVFDYTVQEGDNSGDLDYVGASSLALNSGTIKDAAGNSATLTLPTPGAANSLRANKALVIDTTAPTLSSAALNSSGTAITLTYSEALSATTAPASAFAVLDSASAVTVLSATVSGLSVTLALGSTINAGRAVTISYTDPTGSDDANAIQDLAGNDAASLSSQSVTNNSTLKSTPTLSTWDDVTKGFGDIPYTVIAPTASVGGTFTYSSSNSSVISISGSTFTLAGGGSATITATFTPTDSASYNSATTTNTVTVSRTTVSATITLAGGTLTYRTASAVSAGSSVAGKVTFKVKGKVIPGCKKKTVSAANSFTATCSYRPSTRGYVTITATLNPTDPSYIGTTTTTIAYFVSNRTGPRGG